MSAWATWRAWQAQRLLHRGARVGVEPRLTGKPTIMGNRGQMLIGDRFRLASRPVVSHLAAGPGAILHIGDDVSIGYGAAISAFQHLEIGSGTRIGPFAIIMDTNFHAAGDQSIHHDCRPVIIGEGCQIGSRVTITRGVTIGAGAEILAGSVVSSSIPPGVCAAGGKARIIGRAGEMASRWESPAAQLPELLMISLDLKMPPDLDGTLIPADSWTDARIPGALAAIENACDIAIDHDAARNARTYADLADAVRHALPRRAKTSGT